MPFLATVRHQRPFVENPATPQRLADIHALLDALRQLQIALPLKKAMLVHALWKVAEVTGNFYPRYRSQVVIHSAGHRIQRDHIFKKETLVAQLLQPDVDLAAVIEHAKCCVVTEEEHGRLHQVPDDVNGWARYQAAQVVVFDMVNETRVV